MNGAQALIRTLLAAGVDVCFANPGTSEMHFVAALDSVPQMRAVLGLYEGVVTGAADGYGRIADRPAATLLHLGPGLANGWANLHNARRARTPVVNVVGDHATYHRKLDAPLTSDVAAVARAVSGWVASPETATELVDTCTEAVAAACAEPGGPATIILPADVSWSQGAQVGEPAPASAPSVPDAAGIEAAAAVLRSGEPTVLLLGGKALRERGLRAANRVAAVTGVRVLAETFPARLQRGAGLPAIDRLGYLAEAVLEQLRGVTQLMLAGTKAPVSFFAYPDKPSELTPQDASVHTLVADGFDATAHLEALAELLAPYTAPVLTELARPELPTGELTAQSFSAVIGALLPERAIISDEANTSGFLLPSNTAGAPRHDVLTLTGGAIGQGLAVALGAAIAAPDRPVLCLEADGSFMYGPSALWTMVREHLDITTVVLSNRAYAILRLELQRVGAQGDGPKAKELLDLSTPALDFVALATGMGMPASRARTAENFAEQLRSAFATPGPHLIEAVIPPLL